MTSTDIDGGCTDEQTPQEALGTICAIVVKVAQESEHPSPPDWKDPDDDQGHEKGVLGESVHWLYC